MLPARFSRALAPLLAAALAVSAAHAQHDLQSVVQQAYLKASNTDPGDQLGYAVAVSGNTMAISAINEDSNATGVNGDASDDSSGNSGAVYVFVRNGSSWSQQAYLKASNTDPFDKFGYSLALSGDTLLVGSEGESSAAPGVDGPQVNNDASDAGAVYVFVRTGTTWSQAAYLKPSNTEAGDAFGNSCAIWGNTIVVGARGEDSTTTGVNGDHSDNGATQAGAAYVFRRRGTIWYQEAYLKASNTGWGDYFGRSVAIWGETILVGASWEDSGSTAVNGEQLNNDATQAGAAYVFVRDGTDWSQEAYLKASNAGEQDLFGTSVALSGDTAVVGAYGEGSSATGVDGDQADDSADDSGAVFVFRRSGTVWNQEAYLKASNTAWQDRFGWDVDIVGDTLVTGAWGESSEARGVNGNQNDNSAADSGAVYIFRRHGTNWGQATYLKASNTERFDRYGWALDLAGETLVVSAIMEDSGAVGVNSNQNDNGTSLAGAGYTFELDTAATSFCSEADDSLASCPCASPGAQDSGCDIAQGTGGVRLDVIAQETTPVNRATLIGRGFPLLAAPTAVAIRAGHLDPAGPAVFGDGLLCVGNPFDLLAGSTAGGGVSLHTFGHGAALGNGDFYYQLWFRNTPIMYCAPTAAFNLSSGRKLTW